ncbi:hypothetical protein BofuT4_uP121450.1 [Botrytis cinerea T4]|uniref:Uncharacterized protein n=1 Tax=Botryotinia fuckeliana (strain T4) TaxID=999810 RepID=G2YNC8_BOTF4|nr:hypothetical protein BofuT4_uP121450.1 [Botrytis cinerea T4]
MLLLIHILAQLFCPLLNGSSGLARRNSCSSKTLFSSTVAAGNLAHLFHFFASPIFDR